MRRNDEPAAAMAPGPGTGEARLRAAIAGLFYFGAVGTVAELVLLGHFEESAQYIPFVALAVGSLALAAGIVRPSPSALRVTRWVMVLLAAVGAIGVFFHYRANMALELELEPDAGGFRLIWLALRGGTPALAPGLMAQLGLIGFLYTYGHPALERGHSKQENA